MHLRWGFSARVLTLTWPMVLGLVSAPLLAQGVAPGALDFGALIEDVLRVRSRVLFGVLEPLEGPATPADAVPRAGATAPQRVLLAGGLDATFVTRRVAWRADMMVFWPDDLEPTHLLLCIEQPRQGVTPGGQGGLNPSVQRVALSDGTVETLLHGMSRCDGIRRTPWGTVLVTEETRDGRAYEILDPLDVTGHWVANRATGDVRSGVESFLPSSRVVQRPALPTMAWEGLTVREDGVVFGVDELRPGAGRADRDGGALYKFVPDAPRTGTEPLRDLAASPLTAGSVYALSVSCFEPSHPSFPQFGQGCEVGVGAWVRVDASSARTDAEARGATGYYRPEDLHRDPLYDGPGIRFCWATTGRHQASEHGSVLCAVDEMPVPRAPAQWFDPRTGFSYLADGDQPASAVAQRFVEGDPRFHSLDNLAFQPGTGHLFVTEDDPFGEVWACLRDGADRDQRTDGCISVASVTDPGAEPTGFTFDGTGRVAYLVIQHGANTSETLDFGSNPVDGRTDDLIRITGFEAPANVELESRRPSQSLGAAQSPPFQGSSTRDVDIGNPPGLW